MMKCIKANYHALHYLKTSKPKLSKAINSNIGKELVNSIDECVLNVLSGNIPLSPCVKRKLKKKRFSVS